MNTQGFSVSVVPHQKRLSRQNYRKTTYLATFVIFRFLI